MADITGITNRIRAEVPMTGKTMRPLIADGIESADAAASEAQTAANAKAPISHASTATTYGAGTTVSYGHVKIINALTQSAHADGTALGAYQGYILNQNKAPNSHASTATTYGIGTSANYGHVKLSDSTSTTSAASAGIAATPAAVKSAYDLAGTAKSTAESAATTAQGAVDGVASATTAAQSAATQATAAAALAQGVYDSWAGTSVGDLTNQITEVKATADAAKVNEYGIFVDDTANATNGYWYKMFTCKTTGYGQTDINLNVLVQGLWSNPSAQSGGVNAKIRGVLQISIRQDTYGAFNGGTSEAIWIISNKSMSEKLKYFAVNVVADSTGNYIEFYIYNNARYQGYKASVIDKHSRGINSTLTFTGYKSSSSDLTALPTSGTIIYSTLGEYLHPLSSAVDSSSETTGATSKAVLLAYETAQGAQNAADRAVKKSGDTMTGGLTVDYGGVVIGSGSVATGEHGFAQGMSCSASGNYSAAGGHGNIASGICSSAKGYEATASGNYSSANGTGCTSAGYASWAGGVGTTANLLCEFVLGRYNAASSGSATSWVSGANAMIIGNGTNLAKSNAFRVTNTGAVYALSAFNSTGADYAEYFEWLDGNPMGEDRIGYFVTLDGDKIRIAGAADDFILGAVSAMPGVIGNSYDDAWQGMYLTDEWGRSLLTNVDVPAVTETVHHEASLDEQGNVIAEAWDEVIELQQAGTEVRFAINPDYNPEDEYVPRSRRDEWCAVGLLGRLRVYQDGSCYEGGYCRPNAQGIAAASDIGYRVISVKGDIAEILFR